MRTGLLNAEEKLDTTLFTIKHFTIGKMVEIPSDLSELDDGWANSSGFRKTLPNCPIAKVLGYKFGSKEIKDRFLPMNIEIEFATPQKIMPMIRPSLTQSWSDVVEWIKRGPNKFSDAEAKSIREWIVTSEGQREKIRVITGEIFRCFEIADELFKNDPEPKNYQYKKRLIKYTTTGSTVEAGIKLWQVKYKDLSEETTKVPIYSALNGSAVIQQLDDKPEKVFWLPSYKEYIRKTKQGYYEIGLFMGRWKSKKDGLKTDSKRISNFCSNDILDEIKAETGLHSNFHTELLMENVLVANTYRSDTGM